MLAVTRAKTSSTGLPVRVEGELRRRQSGPYHLWWGGRGLLLRNLRPFWLFLTPSRRWAAPGSPGGRALTGKTYQASRAVGPGQFRCGK